MDSSFIFPAELHENIFKLQNQQNGLDKKFTSKNTRKYALLTFRSHKIDSVHISEVTNMKYTL
jgi:hypothetical protein